MDKDLRNLERFQDPIRLKLLQRRLGQSVYIQEFPRPIKVFNSTELLIDISKIKGIFGDGYEGGTGRGEGDGDGSGYGDRDRYGLGYGFGSGDGAGFWFGHGYGSVIGVGGGSGAGYGYGYGSESGESEDSYTQYLREKLWIRI